TVTYGSTGGGSRRRRPRRSWSRSPRWPEPRPPTWVTLARTTPPVPSPAGWCGSRPVGRPRTRSHTVIAFDRFTDALDYPMYVVTAEADGERAGCLVGFGSQCSMRPARFMVWVSELN